MRICFLISFVLSLFIFNSKAQTSWIGADNTKWNDRGNWTAGVPGKSDDVIIGDANFTGSNQPVISGKSAKCQSLSIGTETKSVTLSVLSNLTINGNITIGANGTINHSGNNRSITLKGNWLNSGTYACTGSNAKVVFSGSTQTINGTTTFKNLTINRKAYITLNSNISVSNDVNNSGSINPTANYALNVTGSLNLESSSTLEVKAEDFTDNYIVSGPIEIDRRSTIHYSSDAISQNIYPDIAYANLHLSGGTTKYLTDNLSPLKASASNTGNISIFNGTFDLGSFSANRASAGGGTFYIADSAFIRIGGSNGFPQNYNRNNISRTSTIEYYGNNQTIADLDYGNLLLKSTSGNVIKTLPSSELKIYGNFICSVGDGTGVTVNAADEITFYSQFILNSATTFNAGSYYHELKSDYENNGIFNGETSELRFLGVNSKLSGIGTNTFYDVHFSRPGISASSTTSIEISGDLMSDWGGDFTHETGGNLTLSGTSKEITGNPISLANLSITGTINCNANINLSGNFIVNGTYTTSNWRTLNMLGLTKTISGSGNISLFRLHIDGEISTSNDITMGSDFSVTESASFIANGGTFDFIGKCNFSGTATLYNIITNSGKYIQLGSNSRLNVANAITNNGSINTTSYTPNTIAYNGSSSQNILDISYYNLEVENGNTKTAMGSFSINNSLTINTGTTFDASTFTIDIAKNLYNYGSLSSGTSTFNFVGDYASRIEGDCTFSTLVVDKNSTNSWLFLRDDIEIAYLNMNSGSMDTDSNTVTITNSRTGSGIILGTITRSHSFADATPYYFEGLNNYITFSSPSAELNSVTVMVESGLIHEFDESEECVDRKYTVTIPAGTYSDASFSFHYEDNEVNTFIEPTLALYRYNNITTSWDSIGADTRHADDNYVIKNGISDATSRWILTGTRNIVRWDGSEDNDWNKASNWTTISGTDMSNRVPNSTDVAQIGFDAYSNAPTVSSNETIGALRFGDSQESTLTISGGDLNVLGGLKGIWTNNAHHTINVASGTLEVGTDVCLSEDTIGHYITLNIGSGTVSSGYNVKDETYGELSFTGNGALHIGKDFAIEDANFTKGSGTVYYNGGFPQAIGSVTYNNLTINKSDEWASITTNTIVNGNLTLNTGGGMLVSDTLNVLGNVTINASTELSELGTLMNVEGNWTNNGTFTPSYGTVCFRGTNTQSVDANTFANLLIDKPSGTLTLSNDILINEDLTIDQGTFNIGTYEANRTLLGGELNLDADAVLQIGGLSNFPEKYTNISFNSASTVEYNGTNTQLIDSLEYGNLVFSNGGINEKTFTGNIVTNGNFTINAGATIEPDSNRVIAYGNFTNNGTFNPSTSTIILNGNSKNFSGNNTVYNLYVIAGSYSLNSGSLYVVGDFFVDSIGSIIFGEIDIVFGGDFVNKGTIETSGEISFEGTKEQTIQLLSSCQSTGIVNFNGTIAPTITSLTSPVFATVNINNTAGVSPPVPWTVYTSFNVASGSSFNGGHLTHTFYGDFNNEGTFTSEGDIVFSPTPPYSSGATISLDGTQFTSSGNVEFGGTSQITILDNSPNYTNISITNTNSAGIKFPNGIYIPGNLYIGEGATLKGGSGLTYTINECITNNGTIDGETSTIVFNGTPSIVNGSGTENFNNLTIDIAAELELHKSINISGNFTNNETFTPQGNSVVFNGTTSSTIGGLTSPVIFDELESNKSSNSTTLSVPVIINNNLSLIDGKIITDETKLLTLIDDATSSEGNSTSFIEGPLKKIGNDAFTYPLGENAIYAPISISAPSSESDAFTAEYTDDIYSNIEDLSAPLNNVSEVEYWILNRTSGSSNIAVTLHWENGTRSAINDLADLRVARFDGSNWINETQDGGTTGDISAGSITSRSISSFSPFTFGSESSGLNPLPVDWISFTATNQEGRVITEWKTASETANDFFTILRSKDGTTFNEAGRIDGAAYSNRINAYTFIDKNPYEGLCYYKIKQTDFNGNHKFSDVQSVFVRSTSLTNMQIYPNPTSLKGDINLKLGYIDSDNFTINIFNVSGTEVYSSFYTSNQILNKSITIPINQTKITSKGQYFIVLTGNVQMDKKSFIVK